MKQFYTILLLTFCSIQFVQASFPVTDVSPTDKTELIFSETDSPSVKEMLTNAPVASDFNFGGFILGFLLGLIGVGLAYIFSDDESFRRSAWYGLGTWLILLILLVGAAA